VLIGNLLVNDLNALNEGWKNSTAVYASQYPYIEMRNAECGMRNEGKKDT
jgi:hypothetical protein